MNKILIFLISFILFFLAFLYLSPMPQEKFVDTFSPPILLAQTKVVTIPGFIEFLDIDAKLIKIDGNLYQLPEKVEITSKGKTKKIDEISIGSFVIATIKDNLVMEITLIPEGQGF